MSQIRLEKWQVFDSLSDQVKRSIRLARVFPTGNPSPPTNAIFVTEEDEVFGFGQNLNGCLGTGDTILTIPHPTPTRIDVLCGQNIQDLEVSPLGNSIYAISSFGPVFAWGKNNFGQLGLGTRKEVISIPTKISGILEGKKVVQVACGCEHTLALTSDGQVFAFGHNDFGQLGLASNASNHDLPARVEGPLAGRFVTAIACQGFSSIALLDSGEVFACGWNGNGNLAINSTTSKQRIPQKVCGLEGVTISKITCGYLHTLALSSDGKIYAWGDNEYGQVGINNTETKVSVPTLISSEIDRVKDIAVLYSTCAALTVSNQIYIWGQLVGRNIRRPTITSLSSLDEVFAQYTFRTLRLKDFSTGKDMKTSLHNYCWLKQAFNDSETADFAFVVEGKKIHVHKTILILRCVVFKTMFLGDWKESHENEHTIEGRSFDAFFAFLKYFYTDELDVQPETAIECLCLAHFYQMNELQVECERLVKSGVTVENAALIYDKALLYGRKELEAFVFDFCLKNLTAVVKSNNFKKLSEQVARNFFQRAAEQGGFKN